MEVWHFQQLMCQQEKVLSKINTISSDVCGIYSTNYQQFRRRKSQLFLHCASLKNIYCKNSTCILCLKQPMNSGTTTKLSSWWTQTLCFSLVPPYPSSLRVDFPTPHDPPPKPPFLVYLCPLLPRCLAHPSSSPHTPSQPSSPSEDYELESIMAGHHLPHPNQEGPHDHVGPHYDHVGPRHCIDLCDAGRECEGLDRPHTPSYLRPPVAGSSQSDSGSSPVLSYDGGADFDLPSPNCPCRPKSPWNRFDPYESTEVTPERWRLRLRNCVCVCVVCVWVWVWVAVEADLVWELGVACIHSAWVKLVVIGR